MKMISLEEISTIVTGGTPSTGKKEYWDGGNIPWLQSGCCQNCYVESASAYITKLGYDNSSTRMMPKDTVLIALTGATAGKVGYLTFEACANQSVTGITPKKGYSPKFIYYYLQYLRPKILFDCIGGAQPHISQGYVKKIQIPGIDLESQEKIVEQIDNIKNEISNCEHQLSLFDELVKSRFIEMFGRVNNTKYETSTINELCEFVKDGTHQTPTYTEDVVNGYKFLSSKDVTSGKIDWTNIKYIPADLHEKLYKTIKPQRNDILLAKNGTTGTAALVECDDIFDIYVSLALLRFKNENNPKYMLYAINNEDTKEQFDNNLVGVGVPNLHLGRIKETKLIVPPMELQNQFVEFVEQIDKSKFNVQSNIGKLNELLDKLMNDSFGGSFNA